MQYNKIHNTDLEVSPIGLGTWVFGGNFWGGSKEDECIDALKCMVDHGVNLIDTAPIYGPYTSEKIVGKAIKGRRERVVIATKCGLIANNGKISCDLSAKSIFKEVDDSLKRLNVDQIDLYQCHWPDPNTSIDETFDTLRKIRDEGKIRYIGVSNYERDLLEKVADYVDVVTLQSHYSLLERTLENDIIPFCEERNIGLLPYGVLGGGILTGKYKQEPNFKGADARSMFYKYYKGEEFKRTQEYISELEVYGKPVNEVALNWVRQHSQVVSALVGCRNVSQAEQNLKALDWELSGEQWDQIKEINYDGVSSQS